MRNQTRKEFNWSDRAKIARLPFEDGTIYNVRALVGGWGRTSPFEMDYLPKLQKLHVETLHPAIFERLYIRYGPGPRGDCFYGHANYHSGTAQV